MALLKEFAELLAKEGATTAETFDPATVTDKDALMVIDMQHDFLPGGAFAVAEGDATVPHIVKLIDAFVAKNGGVYATRDYHPVDHCSFMPHGGPFPPHCVQGTRGAELVPGIAAALQPHVAAGAAHVVFKGFSAHVDSFGGMQYDDADIGKRVTCKQDGSHCGVTWTGAYVLFSSNMANDCNAPPDVMAVLDKKALQEALPPIEGRTLYVVGLALDFCVLDTAVNAARKGHKVVILLDAARAAHIPGLGQFGSGFLSDPAEVAGKLKEHNITLMAL